MSMTDETKRYLLTLLTIEYSRIKILMDKSQQDDKTHYAEEIQRVERCIRELEALRPC